MWKQIFTDNNHLNPDPESIKKEWKSIQENEEKLKSQIMDLKIRESALVIRLSQKEQEIHTLVVQNQDLKSRLIPNELNQTRTIMLNPSVNLAFQRMKEEVHEYEKKMKESQEDQRWLIASRTLTCLATSASASLRRLQGLL